MHRSGQYTTELYLHRTDSAMSSKTSCTALFTSDMMCVSNYCPSHWIRNVMHRHISVKLCRQNSICNFIQFSFWAMTTLIQHSMQINIRYYNTDFMWTQVWLNGYASEELWVSLVSVHIYHMKNHCSEINLQKHDFCLWGTHNFSWHNSIYQQSKCK